jgi:ribokinase
MIVVFGSVNLDIFFRCARLPEAGETLLCRTAETAPGGKGANQALAAARDGAEVSLVGAVGRDAFADEAFSLLSAEGVDLTAVSRVDSLTGCATIAVAENGENAIVVGSGANLQAQGAAVPGSLLNSANWLLLQMEVPHAENWALLERAKGYGVRVMLNLAPFAPIPHEVLSSVDLLVLNDVEAGQLAASERPTDDIRDGLARMAADYGVTLIVTLGGDGLEAFLPEGNGFQLPAFKVRPVDTTGAGDCFCGVLAAGLDRNIPLREAAERASAGAALSCTRAGAQTSFPTSLEIDAQLAYLETRPAGR